MNKIILSLIIITILLPSYTFAQEEVSCVLDPFSQTLKEKGNVTFTFSLQGAGDATRLSLGGLPGGVIGSFKDNNELTLNALQGAQLGSFDISVLYDVQGDNILMQSSCSFNIVVEAAEERDITQDYIPSPSHAVQIPAVIEIGTITAEPIPHETIVPDSESDNGTFVSPLYRGVRSEEVKELQSVLKEAGYFPSWVSATGYYGEITEKAVSDFQIGHGIESVGFVGPLTRAALNNVQL